MNNYALLFEMEQKLDIWSKPYYSPQVKHLYDKSLSDADVRVIILTDNNKLRSGLRR